MTADQARRWLILASLYATGAQAAFLLVAPIIGIPIEFDKSLGLLQIVAPVFVGYLGSAAHFVFMSPPPEVPVQVQFLDIIVKGPIFVYVLIVAAAFIGFTYSNRTGALIGGGMSLEALSAALTIALGLLSSSTAVVVSYLFAVSNRDPQKS